MYNVITAICLALMLSLVIYITVRTVRLKKLARLKYLKGFKKGKCLLIYFAVAPMFVIAALYKELPLGYALLSGVRGASEMIFLKFDYSVVRPLMDANVFFCSVMALGYVLVLINAAMFTVTLFGQQFWSALRCRAYLTGKRKVHAIIGYSDRNLMIARSVRGDERAVIFGKFTQDQEDEMFAEKIAYCRFSPNKAVTHLRPLLSSLTCRDANLVVNTGDDEQNLIVVRQLGDEIVSKKMYEFTGGCDNSGKARLGFNVYVFGEPENESVFDYYTGMTSGCVHYVSKYRLIAADFIDKYPMTAFTDSRHIDRESACVKPQTDLRVLMLGFGKTSQQLFLASVANNQFIQKRDGKITEKQVQYYLYDKENSCNNKNLNHTYYRFKTECGELKGREDEYLPLPALPAADKAEVMDINDNGFYDSIRKHISPQKGRSAVNYIIVSFGSDLENVDLGQKLCSKLHEWNIGDTHVFVKVRSRKLGNVIAAEMRNRNEFIVFGNECDTVYDIHRIADERIEQMAILRHKIYHTEYELKAGGLDKAPKDSRKLIETYKTQAMKNWYRMNSVKRLSNVYACLSLRSKLQMIGLDYVPQDACGDELSYDEYMDVYGKNDRPNVTEVTGHKPIVDYTLDFADSLRGNLARQEHLRWNAYMISCGIVPASIDEIMTKENNGQDYELRRHGNITTFEGLVTFRKMIAQKTGKSENETDVIKYDYQLLDDAYYLVRECGCKIIRRSESGADVNK